MTTLVSQVPQCYWLKINASILHNALSFNHRPHDHTVSPPSSVICIICLDILRMHAAEVTWSMRHKQGYV